MARKRSRARALLDTSAACRDAVTELELSKCQSVKVAMVQGWQTVRHSFCSNCALKGLDQCIIDFWMGHQIEEMPRATGIFSSITRGMR